MKTRRDVIDQILDNLGIIVPGQAPGDEAVSRVDNALDPALSTMAALGYGYVADRGLSNPPTGGEFDDERFLPICARVTPWIAPAFNLQGDPSFKVLGDEAELMLRTIERPAATRQVLRTDGQLRGSRTRSPVGNFTRGT